MNQKDHMPGITTHYKYVEKYQLLGGIKSLLMFYTEIVCGKALLSAYVCNYIRIT